MQILLENAFKHNINSEEEPLEVKVWYENDFIIVRNQIHHRKATSQQSGIGLETIKKRYEFFSKKHLEIDSINGYFSVKLPILHDI